MDITQLAQQFVVDPSSPSGLRNKIDRGPRAKAGDVAGTERPGGYWQVRVDGKNTASHRIVWMLTHGVSVPAGHYIDHKDRTKTNAPDNLRPASPTENAYNSTRQPGESGYVGVTYHRRDRKYRAQVCFAPGKPTQVAYCTTAAEAAACRDYVLLHLAPTYYVPSGSAFQLSPARIAKLNKLLEDNGISVVTSLEKAPH